MPYQDWGFSSSPFQTSSLPAAEIGEKLLVGRSAELASLQRRIQSTTKMATIEGINGIGKTSVSNVSSYKLYKKHAQSGEGPLFIPCRKIFQLSQDMEKDAFIDFVLMEIAQTLIEKKSDIKKDGHTLKTEAIDRWLNSPQLVSLSGGVWIINAGIQKETNTGSGFERSGFRRAVLSWLETIFPTKESGGIICTIDNLELLQSSEEAKKVIENLRDELFNIHGVRWILCGALGIIYGVLSSPRMEGYLHQPISIGEINEKYVPELFESRISAYSKNGQEAYLPLTIKSFSKIYSILKGNLRSVLSYSDDYCQWIADEKLPQSEQEKDIEFNRWLSMQSKAAYDTAKKELRPRPLEIFNISCEKTLFSPSDYADFGCNSIPAFRPHIKELEGVGLLVSTQDDGDKRKKTIQVTPKGFMVKYYIENSDLSKQSDIDNFKS